MNGDRISYKSSWQHAMQSIHGDLLYTIQQQQQQSSLSSFMFDNIHMLQDAYCQYSCSVVWNDNDDETSETALASLIQNDYRYHYYMDQLPTAYRYEDQ
jgi:hypothetical protein